MAYQVTGSYLSQVCSNVPFPLWGATIRFYSAVAPKGVRLSDLVAADQKDNFKILNEDEIGAKADRLVGEVEVSEQGRISLTLNDRYDGEELEIDIRIEGQPNPENPQEQFLNLAGTLKGSKPVQATIDVVQPKWKRKQEGGISQAPLSINLLSSLWCRILEALDMYVVCGTVLGPDCQIPVGGALVMAYDDDVFQDDYLGSAETNSQGQFCLYYTEAALKRTIIPGFRYERTGPDLFFKVVVASNTSVVLLDEPPSIAKTDPRCNMPRCACVRLCVEEKPGNQGGDPIVPLFTRVGSYRISTDFTPGGLANASGGMAFTRTIPLMGTKPGGAATVPWEYRFLYKRAGAPGSFTPIDSGMIPTTLIGELLVKKIIEVTPGNFVTTYDPEPYYLNSSNPAVKNVNVGVDGWIPVPTENNINDPAIGQFYGNAHLANFNTLSLVDQFFDLITPNLYEAGQSIPAGIAGLPKDTFTIRFEAREVGTVGIAHTVDLPNIKLSNTRYEVRRHPYWSGGDVVLPSVCMIDIVQLKPTPGSPGNGCGEVGNQVTIRYSGFQPYLHAVKLWLVGNGIPGGGGAYQLSPAISTEGEATGSHTFNMAGLPDCAYIAKLNVVRNLTSGHGRVADADTWDEIGFCKRSSAN